MIYLSKGGGAVPIRTIHGSSPAEIINTVKNKFHMNIGFAFGILGRPRKQATILNTFELENLVVYKYLVFQKMKFQFRGVVSP